MNNPYEMGKKDFHEGKISANPFPEFSEKWALYNRGYNSRNEESFLSALGDSAKFYRVPKSMKTPVSVEEIAPGEIQIRFK